MTTSEASEQHPHDPDEVLAGRYRLGARIGSGSTGIVYRAEDLMYDRQVAVRLLTPALSREEETIARLEARLHRNTRMLRDDVRALSDIVDLIDLGRTEGGQAFVVTELLPGESLADLLTREGPLPWRRLRPLAVRACQIVHLSHEHGVVRQDLQTRNLYPVRGKAEAGTLRVYSPGLGVAFGERLWSCLDPGEALLLARYAAPEQISSGGIDRRTDVYALGVILYECLTGQVPFTDPRPAHVLAAHLLSPPPPFPSDARRRGSGGELEAIVLRCLAKAPDDRWPTALALANAMAAIEFGPVDASGAIEAGELNDLTDLLEPAPSATTMRIDRSRISGRAGVGPISATELARPAETATDPAASTSELAWREILDAAESAIGAVVRDHESRDPQEPQEPAAASVSTLTRNSVTAPDDISDSTPTLAYGAETSAARWNSHPPAPAPPRRGVRTWPIAAALALTTATGVAYFVRSSTAPKPAQDTVGKRAHPSPPPATPVVVTAPPSPPAAEPPPVPPPSPPPATEPPSAPPAEDPAPAPVTPGLDPSEPPANAAAAQTPDGPSPAGTAPAPAPVPVPASAPPAGRRPRTPSSAPPRSAASAAESDAPRPPRSAASVPVEGDAPKPPRKALPAARSDQQEHELPDPAAPAPAP